MGIPTCTIVTLVYIFSVGSLGSSSQVQLLGDESVSFEKHTPIILRCRVPATVTEVAWERDSVKITEDPTKKITITFNHTDSSTRDNVLTIAEAEHTDSGSYSCSGGGSQSDKIVRVTVTESQIKITAIQSLVNLVPGSPLSLSCYADIHTHVEWRKGSTVLGNEGEVTITEETNSDPDNHIKISKLTINSAMASHAGTYVCKNEHHDDDRGEITVSLKSETSGKSSTSEVSALLLGSVVVFALIR